MGNFFKWNMFFTSFLPLWISIIVSDFWSIGKTIYDLVNSPDNPTISIGTLFINTVIELVTIIVLIVYSVISVYSINKTIKNQKSAPNHFHGTITRAKRANKLTAEFLLAYILPMIAFDYSDLKSIVLFLIYFSVLTYLCIRNSNIYTNIYLEFKGYRMYECDITCNVLGKEHPYTDSLIFSKNNLTQALPHEIDYFDFENYIYIEI
ncbi:MAG: hypothetical protein K0S01_3256 [Herbinix sp.]|jgi:uncharacterized membrane protein|nr:hypothetical protein [Herbinix sp.]